MKMFLYEAFYSNLFLILYFFNYISNSECYLLSRAKNPFIIASVPVTLERDMYQYDEHKHETTSKALNIQTPETQLSSQNTSEKILVALKNIKNENIIIYRDFAGSSSEHIKKPDHVNSSLTAGAYTDYGFSVRPEYSMSRYDSDAKNVDYYIKIPPASLEDDLPDDYRQLKSSDTPTKMGNVMKYNKFSQAIPKLHFIRQYENRNRYETVGTSELPRAVYQFEPLGTSSLPENVYRYEHINFSPLYLEETNWRKTSSPQKYSLQNEKVITSKENLDKNTITEIIEQFYPLDSSGITLSKQGEVLTPFKDILLVDNSSSSQYESSKTEYNFSLLGTPSLLDVTSSIETLTKKRKKFNQFTPLLTFATIRVHPVAISSRTSQKSFESSREYNIMLSFRPSKAHETQHKNKRTSITVKDHRTMKTSRSADYWNIFWKMETGKTSTETDAVYTLAPVVTTKVAEEYWNEFIHTRNTVAADVQDYENMRKTKPDKTQWVRDYSEIYLKTSEDSKTSDRATSSNKTQSSSNEYYDYQTQAQISSKSSLVAVLPEILRHFGHVNEQFTTEPSTKIVQGFKTLWKATITQPSRTTYFDVAFIKPTRTTKVFEWKFNDNESAWPNIEIVSSTTKKITTLKKTPKTFQTYFPFYLRGTSHAVSGPVKTQSTVPLYSFSKHWISKETEDYLAKEIARIGERSERTDRCYECGLDIPDIPYYPTCHHIFNGQNQQTRYKMLKYRKKCSQSLGCFKRFVDLGDVYDERGCRQEEPQEGLSFASKRLARLEKALRSVDEGCIASPHASLTPFSKAISLFAKYYACVCKTRYCNIAQTIHSNSFIIFLNIRLSI